MDGPPARLQHGISTASLSADDAIFASQTPHLSPDANTTSKLRTSVQKVVVAGRVVHQLENVLISPAIGYVEMTKLCKACCRGNVEIVKSGLETATANGTLDEELEFRDAWAGSTPLHWAAFSGSAEIISLLLDEGADFEASNKRDASLPVHLAARYNKVATLTKLCEVAPHTLLVLSGRGNTPLHEASVEGAVEAVRKILELGRNFELTVTAVKRKRQRRASRNSLDLRISGGVSSGVSGNASGDGGETAARITLKALLAVRSRPVTRGIGNTPLLAAVEHGRSSVISLLLDAKADPTLEGNLAGIQRKDDARATQIEPIADRERLYNALFRIGGATDESPDAASASVVGGAGGGGASPQRGGRPQAESPLAASDDAAHHDPAHRWRIHGHGALSLGLAAGHMRVVEQLLEAEEYPVCLSFELLREIVLRRWANTSERERGPSPTQEQRQTARLFALLVLCGQRPESSKRLAGGDGDGDGDTGGDGDGDGEGGSEAEDEAEGWGEKGEGDGDDVGGGKGDRLPQNPCLVALKLATACHHEAAVHSRDRLKRDRLKAAADILQV